MRALGVDLPRTPPREGGIEPTIVMLDAGGRVSRAERVASAPAIATEVARMTAGEPFLLGVNAPVVVPEREAKRRPIEGLVQRRLGARLPAGGRLALGAEPGGIVGERLLASLAAAGRPCLPYPDRNQRQPCVAEILPKLVLRALLWQLSPTAAAAPTSPEELFRAYEPPSYRSADIGSRATWARHAVAVDLLLGALAGVEGYDLDPARESLAAASSRREVERAAALLDAVLIAATARRYLDAPESCLFLGDQQSGYVILPADDFIRRLTSTAKSTPRDRLFPQASLRERLGSHAQMRQIGLIDLPDRPQQTEASFKDSPRYEFDNLDEMLWWKHCRHVEGPLLPTEGLRELVVALSPADPAATEPTPLKLARSRHRTLSFRFEPPAAWRARVPTRDGKTYPFVVLRALYETAPRAD